MKTNKEIKPFKMRVTKSEYKNAVNILLFNGYKWGGFEEYAMEDQPEFDDVVAITLEDSLCILRYTLIGNTYHDDCLPELTYSQFMKLYGEEEKQTFSYETVMDLISYLQKEYDCEHWSNLDPSSLMNDFLSERTND